MLTLTRASVSLAICSLLIAMPPVDLNAQDVPSKAGKAATRSAEGGPPAENKRLVFEVASIRPSGPNERTDEQFLPDGLRVTQRSLKSIIMWAYFPRYFSSEDWLLNAPPWTDEFYDVVAKVAPEDMAAWQEQTRNRLDNEGLRSALQALLADRCKLVAHRVPIEVPGYDLVVGRHGTKLKPTQPDEVFPKDATVGPDGTLAVTLWKNDTVEHDFYNASMAQFVASFSFISGTPILDKTGLTGRYDFVLHDSLSPNATSEEINSTPPSTRWDVEALGLKLLRAKVPAAELVIDHIEQPSPN